MSWIALDALSDAREATEELLLPVERGTWIRLAILAFFLGGGGGAPAQWGGSAPSGGGGGGGELPPGAMPSIPWGRVLPVVAGLVLVGLALFAVWLFVGAVMEFVLVGGLRDREIRLRRPFRENVGRGTHLFAFRLALWLVGLAFIGVPLLAIFGVGIGIAPLAFLFILPAMVLFGVVAIAGAIVMRLTTDFVVPTMLVEDRGIVDGWRRLWPMLRAEWKEFGLYVVVRFAVGIGANLAVGIVLLLVALVVAIPFALVGGALYAALVATGGPGLGGWMALGALVALFALVMVVAALVAQVPVLTYLRYYSLATLGRAAPSLDVVGVDREESGGGESETETGA